MSKRKSKIKSKKIKSQIITFICSEDFKYIYEKGKDKSSNGTIFLVKK